MLMGTRLAISIVRTACARIRAMPWGISSRVSFRCAPQWVNARIRCSEQQCWPGTWTLASARARDGASPMSIRGCSLRLAFSSQESAHGQVRERSQRRPLVDRALAMEIESLRKLKTKALKARYRELVGDESRSSNHLKSGS